MNERRPVPPETLVSSREYLRMAGLSDLVTVAAQVAVGGNKRLVEQVLPILQECYEGYQGFK